MVNLTLLSADWYRLEFQKDFEKEVAKPYQHALDALSNRVIKFVYDEVLPSLLLNDSALSQSLLTNVHNRINETLQQANRSCNGCETLNRRLKQTEESYIKEITDARQMLEAIEINMNQLDEGIKTPKVQKELSSIEQQYSDALRARQEAHTVSVNLCEELAAVRNCIYRPKRNTIATWDLKKGLKHLAAKIINYPCYLFNGSGIRETEEKREAANRKLAIASQKVLEAHVRNYPLVKQRDALIENRTRITATQSGLQTALESSRDSAIIVANFSSQLKSIMERLNDLKITDNLSHNSISKLSVNMGHLLPALRGTADLALIFSDYLDLADSYELSLTYLILHFNVLKEKIANYPDIHYQVEI